MYRWKLRKKNTFLRKKLLYPLNSASAQPITLDYRVKSVPMVSTEHKPDLMEDSAFLVNVTDIRVLVTKSREYAM